jgi:hypothetical protein
VLETANAADINGVICDPRHRGTRNSIFCYQSTDRPLQTSLNLGEYSYDYTKSAELQKQQCVIISLLSVHFAFIPLTLYPQRGSRGISDIPSIIVLHFVFKPVFLTKFLFT